MQRPFRVRSALTLQVSYPIPALPPAARAEFVRLAHEHRDRLTGYEDDPS